MLSGVGNIREVISGNMRLKSTGAETEETRKIKGDSLRMPLCVLEVLKTKRQDRVLQYRVRLSNEPGEWLIKRRYVLKTDEDLDRHLKIEPPDCREKYSREKYSREK